MRRMTLDRLALGPVLLIAGAAGTAAAQGFPGGTPTPPADPTPVEGAEPAPEPPPPPPEPPRARRPRSMHGDVHGGVHGDVHGGMHGDVHGGMHGEMHGRHGGAHGHGGPRGGARPLDPTIGLGFGYALPASWEAPNVTSVRFRLASGLTLEPRVELGAAGTSVDNGFTDSEDSFFGMTLGARGRLALAARGRADFVLVGGAELGFARDNPEGPDNNTSATTFGLVWGIGIDYWLGHSFSLSMTATNPLLAYSKQSQEAEPDDLSSSAYSIGAVFDPQLDVMLHMFF